MKDQLSDEQNEALVKALNEAIDSGAWDKSNFLKAIGNNLNELRDDFLAQLGTPSQAQLKAESRIANQTALRSGLQEIFVSLYSSDGGSIQSWEKILTNLPRQMISRPIYADEEDIKAIIKTKEHKQNEAYVAIFINKEDILQLSTDKIALDKLGKTLLSLKDRTLNLENVSRFVHQNIVYKFDRNRLVKIS